MESKEQKKLGRQLITAFTEQKRIYEMYSKESHY